MALGTIADLVPLVDENRILVTAGLKRLNQTKRPGLLALMEIAQVRDELGVFEISFQLGPRINAAGRLVNADTALRLMLSDDLEEARQLARELDAHNRQRQMIERDIADQAVDSIRSEFDPKKDFVIVQGNGDWHVGVVGIVASRVLESSIGPPSFWVEKVPNGVVRGEVWKALIWLRLCDHVTICSNVTEATPWLRVCPFNLKT